MTPSDTAFALISRVERIICRQGLFRPGDTLIVALSGGADSTFLLDLLSRLPGYNLRLIVAHLNHCLRGAESDADEEFCRDMALRYAIPFESRRIDIKAMASAERLNLEDAGRRARIAFLDETCVLYGASAVALAHHGDDQAETVLMRLLRGSGTTGLSGMAYRNARGYVRPLLDIARSDIEQYLRERGLTWREDVSNGDTIYLRNRIRHELLPFLEGYNPAIRTCLAATATRISDDEVLLRELTEQAAAGACMTAAGDVVCSITHLRTLSPALRRRVLRHAFNQVAGTLEGVGQRHIDALCALIDSERPNSRLDLPHGVAAVRAYDRLACMKSGTAVSGTDAELSIAGPGRYQLSAGGCLSVEGIPTTFPDHPCSVSVDLDKTPFPWLIRTFRSGDRMTPLGMHGRKKVKDIFIDRKIPLSERRRIPLLLSGDDLIWIAGVCASELCRIDSRSGAVVRVTWHP